MALVALNWSPIFEIVNCDLVSKCTIYEALAGRNPKLPIKVELLTVIVAWGSVKMNLP